MKYRIVTKNGRYRIQRKLVFFHRWKWMMDGKYCSAPLEFDSGDRAIGKVLNFQKADYNSAKRWKVWVTDPLKAK